VGCAAYMQAMAPSCVIATGEPLGATKDVGGGGVYMRRAYASLLDARRSQEPGLWFTVTAPIPTAMIYLGC
jgi:hypothetical protein